MKTYNQQATTQWVKWAVAGLLFLLAAQAMMSMRQKSVTTDEIMYITAGYYHLETGDFSMNTTNPPLMKLVAAIPLATAPLELPPIEGNPRDWDLIAQWQYARSFLYHNQIDADQILFRARLAIVVVSMILGLYVFLWSKELYGEKAGLFALFLYSFSPNILAHSRLATQDLGLTAFMFISTYYFWQFGRHPGVTRLILCGLFFGLAVLTKTAALFLLPVFSIYALICILKKNGFGLYENLPLLNRLSRRQVRGRQFVSLTISILSIGFLGLIVLNLGYGLQGTFAAVSSDYRSAIYERLPKDNPVLQQVTGLILELPVPLPGPYVEGLRFQTQLSARDVFFAGKIYDRSLWYFTIVSFLIKTPIPVLILLAAALGSLVRARRTLEVEWLLITFIGVILFIISFLGSVNVALRYILPIYPFIHLLISRLLRATFPRPRPVRALGLALSVWYLAGTILIYPHYLAYFNEFIGGPKNGYHYLVTSNLDWGQDLKNLKHYMDQKGIEKVKLAYLGSADAAYYGINYDYLPSVGLAPKGPGQKWWYEMDVNDRTERLESQTGVIAISASLLGGRFFPNAYHWLKENEPIDQIGYSILIYKIE